jgi:peptidoglycan hydrolase CwlO-like protein
VEELHKKLDHVLRQNTAIQNLLILLLKKENTMTTAFEDLTANVAAQSTVIASVQTLISNLHGELAAAIQAAKVAGTDTVALEALAQQVKSNSAALIAAVVANTPAAPLAVATPATPPAHPVDVVIPSPAPTTPAV